ncbi:hypothetical protein KPC83_07090 [Collinsella sp. zg1085]|uniref:hypothetical protein n=1 Tax=Collinsella sp. zg1085 TaxID=2844380 RepID=UPI001C0DFB4C|nr:hypothetical protein [Collinsella sp. zg1085]QWT17588.1 hypothetical protein KPC83_07090 [Collinsella sp. zg1085]
MIAFIKKHWRAYLIGALLAIALGAGASIILGIKASTPEDLRQKRIEAERRNSETQTKLAHHDDIEEAGSENNSETSDADLGTSADSTNADTTDTETE